jgi:dolichyl-phosphate beta-glucosyltransferase
MAWPAWAIPHAANVFFSGAVNVPHGANLLSNTSGTLVSVVLSPVTWLWGPVVSTNVALTLAPGLSAWGCWVALRPFVTWKPGAVPAALVYGYSAAIVTSLEFGHVSVSVLVVPPLLLACVYEIVVWQARSPRRDGVTLAALVIVQFLISPEVLVMCALLAGFGLLVTVIRGRRTVRAHAAHALRALALGTGVSVALLAYPAWFGLSGPQSVSGVLFSLAPLSGVHLSGFLSPGPYRAVANSFTRFGGYYGRLGPPSNYLGWGVVAGSAVSLYFGRRRPFVWLLVFLTLVAMVLSLGSYLLGGSLVLTHAWLPWRTLGKLPVLREILPDQFAPLASLFVAFILALGLDALHQRLKHPGGRHAAEVNGPSWLATIIVGVVALAPVFITFDIPFAVQATAIPVWMARQAPRLPNQSVLLTVPFPMSGSDKPMLWQAVDDMHFRLAGGGLKTPNAQGGPIGEGAPGSARRILAVLSVGVSPQPKGTAAQLSVVRHAVKAWHVSRIVIDGPSRDPVYASGFFTAALGAAPSYDHGAWVWVIPAGGPSAPPATGVSLATCRAASPRSAKRLGHRALSMADCVLHAAASHGGPA